MTRLNQGAVRPRLIRGNSQAHGGIAPLSPFTHRTQRFEPLPTPLGNPPYHYDLETAIPGIGASAATNDKLVFHVTGDTGGVKDPNPQVLVAKAMAADLVPGAALAPSFFYHLGDVVYFNGEYDQYYEQFYEPYDDYTAPIFSIPGNHDGDPLDDSQSSLDGWTRFFMTDSTHPDPESGDHPRLPMAQPNPYFTLVCPFATIVGLYTNVPEHGSVDSIQQQWLTNELATADPNKALIVSMHHPVYSFDTHHSGSSRMADVLQQAINDSRRVPNLVLTAHVHDYQRIEKQITGADPTTFLVVGCGGYHNLHTIHSNPGDTDPNTGATLIYGDSSRYGYVTLSVNRREISGTFTAIDKRTEQRTNDADAFAVSAASHFLGGNETAAL